MSEYYILYKLSRIMPKQLPILVQERADSYIFHSKKEKRMLEKDRFLTYNTQGHWNDYGFYEKRRYETRNMHGIQSYKKNKQLKKTKVYRFKCREAERQYKYGHI